MLQSLISNTRVFAQHVKTDKNGMADALSRLQFNRFESLCRKKWEKEGVVMDYNPTNIPDCLLQMEKLWLN